MSFRLGNFVDAAVKQPCFETARDHAMPVIALKIVARAEKREPDAAEQIEYFDPRIARAIAVQTSIGA